MATMLLAALAGPAGVAPAGAALRYTEVTVTERDGSEAGRMVTRTTLDGLRARIDFLAGEEEGAPVVASLVTSDGAGSVAFTEAGKETCSQLDPGELFSTVGRLVAKARKLVSVKVSGNGVEKLLEEEGPSILGHPTKHIRLRTTYTFKATALFVITYSVSEEVVDDFWVARELKDEPIGEELQKAMSRTGVREVDALIGEAVAQVPGVVVMGQFPTAGVEAETARGNFLLPGDMELTVPTGRFLRPDGSIFLEGQGVQLDVVIPVTLESVLADDDVVLFEALSAAAP